MTSAEDQTAVIIVDHGSRRAASNEMLLAAVEQFRELSRYSIVEPAHMELAQPDIASAFARCVEQGAGRIVVFPYFLSPGRHWSEDIPALVKAAAEEYPNVSWMVTAPFGLHPGMTNIINDRIDHCLRQAEQQALGQPHSGCDVCSGQPACNMNSATP
ncbi:MAG: hypothetical protein JNL58_19950 [Planctomyces sp.]|nr:hypothetical protein [Planctomyces sp.]